MERHAQSSIFRGIWPERALRRIRFPVQLAIRHESLHIPFYRDLAGQSGRFALACQAHVQTIIPNIDEPEFRAALLCDPERTFTRADLMNTGTVKFNNDQKVLRSIQADQAGKDVFVRPTALGRAGMWGLAEDSRRAGSQPARSGLGSHVLRAGFPALIHQGRSIGERLFI